MSTAPAPAPWRNRIAGLELVDPATLNPNPGNWRRHPASQRQALGALLGEVGWVGTVLANRTTGNLIDGHARHEEAIARGEPNIPVTWVELTEEEERAVLALFDPLGALAQTDGPALEALLDKLPKLGNLEDLIASLRIQAFEADPERKRAERQAEARTTLCDRFLVPPFSVFDTRQGYWNDRKRAWKDLGIAGAAGRDAPCLPALDPTRYTHGGRMEETSVFDPVLAEVIYRWFCPEGGHVLDPFAGEATKGIVAAVCGYAYTGVELREEQIAANRAQFAEVAAVFAPPAPPKPARRKRKPAPPPLPTPAWTQGDSAALDATLPEGERYDLMFTSPPYFDLEVYSKREADGSAFESYDRFRAWYADIIRQCCERLRDNRFAVVKVGDIRDKRGAYRGFVSDAVQAFTAAGLHFLAEIILVNPVGSAGIRASAMFQANRKPAKVHQNVLVAYRGDPDDIAMHFTKVVDAFNGTRGIERTHEQVIVAYKGDPRHVAEHHGPVPVDVPA